jgi:hypothetical protein
VEKINYRRDLIAKWRKMVEEASRERDNNARSVKEILERHRDFYSLRPHLRQKARRALYSGMMFVAGTSVDPALYYIIEDIAEMKKIGACLKLNLSLRSRIIDTNRCNSFVGTPIHGTCHTLRRGLPTTKAPPVFPTLTHDSTSLQHLFWAGSRTFFAPASGTQELPTFSVPGLVSHSHTCTA